ncbi:uncharacterized protein METZ01_LOCUS25278 [marine metagenome]|uniref:Uncharacterized protein n=1 Tax=marine metagenome TaxID=408172 RepID=A0A381Q0N0_9ZZZZ
MSLTQYADKKAIPHRAQCQHIPANNSGKNPRTASALRSRRDPSFVALGSSIAGAYDSYRPDVAYLHATPTVVVISDGGFVLTTSYHTGQDFYSAPHLARAVIEGVVVVAVWRPRA